MKVFHSRLHRLHMPAGELYGGQMVEPFERISRVANILEALNSNGFSDISEPEECDMKPVQRVHKPDFIQFLETAWGEWKRGGYAGDLIATTYPTRGTPTQRCPQEIDGKAGYYCIASETAIVEGTWEAAKSSCASAQSAARHVMSGKDCAFALCRPPGHHATADQYGGYCFINNAAVAAAILQENGAGRVAVVDVDFHHGNGTQDIFYDSGGVMFASLHGEPEHAFPYYSGWKEETGTGQGEGANLNFPMPPGTKYSVWAEALAEAISAVRRFSPDSLVISLGVDAYKEDPISFFKLETEDFTDCGARLAALGLPTVIVMEGGYAISEAGANVVSFLNGFLNG